MIYIKVGKAGYLFQGKDPAVGNILTPDVNYKWIWFQNRHFNNHFLRPITIKDGGFKVCMSLESSSNASGKENKDFL